MKKIFSCITCIAIISAFSCHSKIVSHKTVVNTESVDSHGNAILLGKCTRERLEQPPYSEWFTKNFSDYKVDTTTAVQLRKNISGKSFIIFMGTWCGDSKREVPRMYKLLDYCGVKSSDVQLIMLNSYDSVYKQSPTHEERGMNIHRVPDLIVLENKNEIGRIVESPVVSLEQDLSDIINAKGYVPNYRIVPLLVKLFNDKDVKELQSNVQDIVVTAQPFKKHVAELRSYGHVLIAAGEFDKALVAYKLNALLYPDDAGVFANLGEFYMKTGNKALAKENYEKTLALQPNNDNAKKQIELLQQQ